MIEATDKLHRILAPRLVVAIGTVSPDDRKNIIPINNITSIRLFYVAMTRTKRHVVFVTDRYRKSKFIKELQDNKEGRELKCPQCHNGELILRSGKAAGRAFKFYGCSNFAYGCTFSRPLKPEGESLKVGRV